MEILSMGVVLLHYKYVNQLLFNSAFGFHKINNTLIQ